MEKGFQNILLLVDLSVPIETHVKKVIELIDINSGQLHLLNVKSKTLLDYLTFKSYLYTTTDSTDAEKLAALKAKIERSFPGLKVTYSMLFDKNFSKGIYNKASEVMADMIVIGRSSKTNLLSYLNTVFSEQHSLSACTAVLTSEIADNNSKIRRIVIPITEEISVQKMRVITKLGSIFQLKIHLVSFYSRNDKQDKNESSAFIRSYQWLLEIVRLPVEYAVLNGFNKPKAILKYTEKIGGDIILVQSKNERKMNLLDIHSLELSSFIRQFKN